MDRLALIALLVSGVIAVVLALRLRRATPAPPAPSNILRVDLENRRPTTGDQQHPEKQATGDRRPATGNA